MGRTRRAIGGWCLAVAVVVTLPAPALVPVSVASSVSSSATSSVAPRHWRHFVMPSGNIACLYDAARLRCDILSGLVPAPSRPCRFFWKGVVLPAAGRPDFLCIIDTVYQDGLPVLAYGSRWQRHGIVCRSRRTGLRCHNPDGHGFRLSRRRSASW